VAKFPDENFASSSKLPVRKAPRIISSAIFRIDGVNCRNDDRKGITAALIRWHWEADDPARPEEKEIVEMASEVESGLGPEVQFSELGMQRIFNSLPPARRGRPRRTRGCAPPCERADRPASSPGTA
jgi:hypothetical protein